MFFEGRVYAEFSSFQFSDILVKAEEVKTVPKSAESDARLIQLLEPDHATLHIGKIKQILSYNTLCPSSLVLLYVVDNGIL